MNKIVFAIVIISLTTILAERPEWYPENAAEIERNCMKQYPVDDETMAKIREFQLEDTPTLRSLLFCSAKGKHVYRPDIGFDPERFVWGFKKGAKMDCNLEFVRECGAKHKELQPEEFQFFSILKCIFDNRNENCTKVN